MASPLPSAGVSSRPCSLTSEATAASSTSGSQFRGGITFHASLEIVWGFRNTVRNIERSLASSTTPAPSIEDEPAALVSSGAPPEQRSKPSKVQNIRGVDRAAQERNTDFADAASIKKNFPFYRGKGKRNVPLARLHKLASRKDKAVGQQWRDLTDTQ